MLLVKIEEKYSFKKKLESQHEKTTSSESSVNEIIKTMLAGENDPSTQDPASNVTDETALIELFNQFTQLMLPVSD